MFFTCTLWVYGSKKGSLPVLFGCTAGRKVVLCFGSSHQQSRLCFLKWFEYQQDYFDKALRIYRCENYPSVFHILPIPLPHNLHHPLPPQSIAPFQPSGQLFSTSELPATLLIIFCFLNTYLQLWT